MAVSNLVQGILFNRYGGNNGNNNYNAAYAPAFGGNQLNGYSGGFGQLNVAVAALQQLPLSPSANVQTTDIQIH